MDEDGVSIDQLVAPPPDRDLPAGRVLLRKELLIAEVSRTRQTKDPGRRSTSRSRRRRWVALTLVPAALVGAAATYALTRSPDQIVDSIGCYAEARLDADTTIVGSDGRDPALVCADIWGSIGGPGQPPPIVACAMPSGSGVGVFPSDDAGICGALGLDPLPAGYEEAAAKFASMRDDLIGRFAQIGCVSRSRAELLTRSVLDDHAFTDWTIHVGDFSETNPCAELAFYPEQERVNLVAGSGEGPPSL